MKVINTIIISEREKDEIRNVFEHLKTLVKYSPALRELTDYAVDHIDFDDFLDDIMQIIDDLG